MGVLNVTPASFSDGGAYSSPETAIAHGLALLDEGADILDIGGESTRPGVPTGGAQTLGLAGAVSAEVEIGRVLPIIEAIKRERPDSVLSIDTYKSTVALAAIEAGVEIVNDVSGFTWDSAMSSTVAGHPCGAVLMHVRGRPHEWRKLPSAPDIVGLVCEELRERLGEAIRERLGEAIRRGMAPRGELFGGMAGGGGFDVERIGEFVRYRLIDAASQTRSRRRAALSLQPAAWRCSDSSGGG